MAHAKKQLLMTATNIEILVSNRLEWKAKNT